MMELIFSKIFDMSMTASVVILCVIIVRHFLRKTPAIFSYILWGAVLFRLLCPVSVETSLSVFNLVQNFSANTDAPLSFDAETEKQDTQDTLYIEETAPLSVNLNAAPQTGGDADANGNPDTDANADTGALSDQGADMSADSTALTLTKNTTAPSFADVVRLLPLLWLLGCVFFVCLTLISLLRLWRKLIGSVCIQKNVYLNDHISSAFVLGGLNPRIYLSSALSEQEMELILLHEHMHIRRGDHLFKALFYLTAVLYWFNPLVWIAFKLFVQDMEMSCDEAVIRSLDDSQRLDYAQTLIRAAQPQPVFYPLTTFSTKNTKQRILHVLYYRTPRVGSILLSLTVLTASFVSLCSNACYADTPSQTTNAALFANSSDTSMDSYSENASPLTQDTAQYIPEITSSDWVNEFLNTGAYADTLQTAPLTVYAASSKTDEACTEAPASLTVENYRFTFHQVVTDGHFYHILMTVNTLDHTPVPYSETEPLSPALGCYSSYTYRLQASFLTDSGPVNDYVITRISPYEETNELQFVLTLISKENLSRTSTHRILLDFGQFYFQGTYNTSTILAEAESTSDIPCLEMYFDDAYVLPSASISFSDSASASSSVLGMILTMENVLAPAQRFSGLILNDGSTLENFVPNLSTRIPDTNNNYTFYVTYPYAIDPEQIAGIFTDIAFFSISE